MRKSRQRTLISRILCAPFIALAAMTCLAGCGMQGDFGELNRTLVRDDIHDWVGRDNEARKPISPSSFQLTDDERQLRDLAFPLIEAPYNRQNFDQAAREYGVIRDTPAQASDRKAYHAHLMAEGTRSPLALYAQLTDDMRNDNTRLPAFFENAGRVQDMDEKRAKSLAYVTSLSAAERRDTKNRIAENARVVARVRGSLSHRITSYRFALERLVISSPSPQAVDAERTLTKLEAEVARYRNYPAPTWSQGPNLAFQR